nr:MAG TPA: hypothetical protein [Caudoviricetes sp.]
MPSLNVRQVANDNGSSVIAFHIFSLLPDVV